MLKKFKKLFEDEELSFDAHFPQTVPKPNAKIYLPEAQLTLYGQQIDKALLDKEVEKLYEKYFKNQI